MKKTTVIYRLIFQQSMKKIREKDEKEEVMRQVQVNQRVSSIVQLKGSIEQSRDNLKALQVCTDPLNYLFYYCNNMILL